MNRQTNKRTTTLTTILRVSIGISPSGIKSRGYLPSFADSFLIIPKCDLVFGLGLSSRLSPKKAGFAREEAGRDSRTPLEIRAKIVLF